MKQRVKILFLIILLTSTNCYAKHIFREEVYQAYWCGKHNGILEYVLNDNTRVDCLTKKYAIEVDFAPKWAECIGQSLYYGMSTKRKATCLLILENPEKDLKYVKRLQKVSRKYHIKIFTITPEEIAKDY